jgi:hypothetical protein
MVIFVPGRGHAVAMMKAMKDLRLRDTEPVHRYSL